MGAIPSKPTPEELEALVGRLDTSYRAAAEALLHADVLLLCTGAGFSADSGLAVYQDIAEVEAYQALGLRYHDICRPQWLRHDPELFYGFWGTCYNDYRDTEPHEGYRSVRQWRDERFSEGSLVDAAIRHAVRAYEEEQQEDNPAVEGEGGSSGSTGLPHSPYPIDGVAGAFFVYTSNVDAHSFDYFEPWEVRECHGNTEVWQCGADSGPCCRDIWRAPLDFRFKVDKRTMRAPHDPNDSLITGHQANENGSNGTNGAPTGNTPERAKAGRVHRPYGRRSKPLDRLPEVGGEAQMLFPEGSNWPNCPRCGARARPAILMFGDVCWVADQSQEMRWWTWRHAVCTVARSARLCGRRLRVLVLEIGCGGNVPTVRHAAEGAASQLAEDADVTVVRVNPDYPLPDRLLSTSGHLRHLALPCRGLEALQHIQKHYEVMKPSPSKARTPKRPGRRPRQPTAQAADVDDGGDSDEPAPVRLHMTTARDASRSRSGSPVGRASGDGGHGPGEEGAGVPGVPDPPVRRQMPPRVAKGLRRAGRGG